MMELTTDKLRARVEDGIGWITFDNPKRRNAVSLEMWAALGDALEALDSEPSVRVAVLTGAGGIAFVAGADISEFDRRRGSAAQRREYGETSSKAHVQLSRFSKPLLSMIRGYCLGGGVIIALGTDVRFATPESRFGIPAARLGLGYEASRVADLARVVGPGAAADILFSGRQLDANEALRLGLINAIVDDHEIESHVRHYAATVRDNAPLTIRAIKASLRAIAESPSIAAEKHAQIAALVDACFDSEDYREGRLAFGEKRDPRFQGR